MAFLANLRSTIAYQTTGSTISTGAIYTTLAGNAPTWSNQITVSMINGSNLGGNNTAGSYYVGLNSIPSIWLTNPGNIAYGQSTLNSINNSAAAYNIAIGISALNGLTTGGGNISIGRNDFYGLTTGSQNTAVGDTAGGFILSTGSGNTYIGATTNSSGVAPTNETAIGYGAVGQGSNTIILGNASATTLYVPAIVRSTTGTLTINSQGGALALQSGGTTCASLTTVDITLGNTSSLYTTVFSTNLNNIQYPTAAYGSQSGSMGWNGNALGGEFSFINNFGNSGGNLGGFTFNNRTGAS